VSENQKLSSLDALIVGAGFAGIYKPRVFMPYIGGMPAYRDKCAAVTAAKYDGFRLAPTASDNFGTSDRHLHAR
jgi:cyclohexanone monooxygenase